MTKNDGGPAFPFLHGKPGMTLRQYYAGQALAGYRANCPREYSGDIAKMCFDDADAMLAQEAGE